MGLAEEAVKGVFRGLRGGFDPVGGDKITTYSDPWAKPLPTMRYIYSDCAMVITPRQLDLFKQMVIDRWGPDQKIFIFKE